MMRRIGCTPLAAMAWPNNAPLAVQAPAQALRVLWPDRKYPSCSIPLISMSVYLTADQFRLAHFPLWSLLALMLASVADRFFIALLRT